MSTQPSKRAERPTEPENRASRNPVFLLLFRSECGGPANRFYSTTETDDVICISVSVSDLIESFLYNFTYCKKKKSLAPILPYDVSRDHPEMVLQYIRHQCRYGKSGYARTKAVCATKQRYTIGLVS